MVEIFNSGSGPIDSATTNGKTAFVISSMMDDLKRNFMVKNLKTVIAALMGNVDDHLLLVLASADTSIQEIEDAFFPDTTQDVEDGVEYPLGQTVVRRIWDYRALYEGNVSSNNGIMTTIQWKLPPRGIPVLRGRGLKIYGLNMTDVSFTNGPILFSMSKIMGGWF